MQNDPESFLDITLSRMAKVVNLQFYVKFMGFFAQIISANPYDASVRPAGWMSASPFTDGEVRRERDLQEAPRE